MTVIPRDIPRIPNEGRVTVESLRHECYQVDLAYGFEDERDIPAALEKCNVADLHIDRMETSFFVPGQIVIATVGAGMALWRETLYIGMSKKARDAADYFKIPTNRMIELGA